MPTVLLIDGFRFFFYSNENNEPCHIHVKKGGSNAKVWLLPEIKDEYFYGFTSKDIKKIKKIVLNNEQFLIEKWNEYFSK